MSRSAIGPSAVSVSEKGAGILWVDSRAGWEDNIYFDWYDFDGAEDDIKENDTTNDDGGGDGDDTPGFEILTLLATIPAVLFILRRRK